MTRCPRCGDVTTRRPHTRSDATECSGVASSWIDGGLLPNGPAYIAELGLFVDASKIAWSDPTPTPTSAPGQSVETAPGIELATEPRMPPDALALVSETDAVVDLDGSPQ